MSTMDEVYGYDQAATYGKLQQLQSLIKEGADVDLTGVLGQTPLMLSAEYQRPKAVKKLLKAGADVNATDNVDGSTCLHYAILYSSQRPETQIFLEDIINRNEEVITLLIAAGADVNCENETGVTPLMKCASLSPSVIKILVEAGADVNFRNSKGESALSRAVRSGLSTRERMIPTKLLLAAGADVHLLSDSDFVGLDPEITILLLSAANAQPKYIISEDLSLKHQCRKVIRSRVLQLHQNTNLLVWIPQLGLPNPLTSYLLFHQTIDEEEMEENNNDNNTE